MSPPAAPRTGVRAAAPDPATGARAVPIHLSTSFVFESSDPAAKPFVADLFARELQFPGRTSSLASSAGDTMRRLGHEPQVTPQPDTIALFRANPERVAIKRDGDSFTAGEVTNPATGEVIATAPQSKQADVDAFIRQNTLEKFGPVRTVKPQLVFEIGFEGIQRSTRHKSGVAVRFPRMLRWRQDKRIEDADTLETLLELVP